MAKAPLRHMPFRRALIELSCVAKGAAKLAALAGFALLSLAVLWGGLAGNALASHRNEMYPSAPQAQAKLSIVYFRETNTIEVKGTGSVVNLTAVDNALKDPSLLEQVRPSEWLLKASLRLSEQVRLELHGRAAGGDVDWLKLRSEPSGYVTVESSNGQVSIRNTRVTSWDPGAGSFDTAFDDGSGRAYVSTKNRRPEYTDNRMDVIDSEVAYLGFFEETAYGISWKVVAEPGEPDKGILGRGLTGAITGSKFHHNYFGVYVWGVGDMVVRNNEFFENYRYGFDAHTFTQRTIVENNFSHNNGTHGIIFAEVSTENIIRHNIVTDNKGHGIMLHERSDNNVVEDNTVTGNDDGVPIFESSRNVIARNIIKNNRVGVRVYGRATESSDNLFENNEISGSESYGVFMYDAARGNTLRGNQILSNGDAGVYLQSAFGNKFLENTIDANDIGIRFDSAETRQPSRDNQVRNNRIENSRQFGIYSYAPADANQIEDNQLSGNQLGDVNQAGGPAVQASKLPLFQVVRLAFPAIIVAAGVITVLLVLLRKRESRKS